MVTILPGSRGSGPGSFTVVGDTLYFWASDAPAGLGPWVLRMNQAAAPASPGRPTGCPGNR